MFDVLARRPIVVDRWLTLHAERVRTARGVVLDPFYVIDERSWACVVASLPEGGILLVEQYRHGAQQITWELPAGDIDDGETPDAAAIRELREETGHQALAAPQPLGAYWVEPARNRSRGYAFFVAVSATAEAQHTDPSEDIRVHRWTWPQIEAALNDGRIAHPVHVTALLQARVKGLI